MESRVNRDPNRGAWALVCVALLAGAVLGLQHAALAPVARVALGPDVNVANPANVATLVASSHVIVKAEVGPTAYRTMFAGYNAQGTLIPPATETPQSVNATTLPPYRFPITDYTINDVVVTLRDCDGIVATPGALKVRMLGDPPSGANPVATDNASDYPIGQENDYRLFFLTRNPDNTTYGLRHGPCSRLTLDGAEVTCSDGARTQLPFMQGLTVQQFTDTIATEVARQNCP
jgi:hypothetical protein